MRNAKMSIEKLMKGWFYIILVVISMIPYVSWAQRVSISTDPIRWMTLSPNAGVEVSLTNHISANVDFSINTLDHVYTKDLSLKHISVNPEIRYWLYRQQFGHYFGCGFEFLRYNVALKDNVYEGTINALSISYGYAVIMNRRLSLTPYVGCDIGLNRKVDYSEVTTGGGQSSFLAFPTKLGVTLTYILN